MRYEIKTERIYAVNDEDYDKRLNSLAAEGWEPFASDYEQDNWYVIRLKKPITEYDC